MKRTLYECSHACVLGKRIYCNKRYLLSLKSGDGSIDVRRLASGEPLTLNVCQHCDDFDSMGPPVPKAERGWLNGNWPIKQVPTARYILREAVSSGHQ
jgi:hypothetical protein